MKLRRDHLLRLIFLHSQARGFAAFAAQGNLLAQHFQQLRIGPGLLHKICDAALHGFDSDANGGPPGHHNNRGHTVDGFQARKQIQALAAGSCVARVIQVHEQKIVFAASERFQQIRRRGDGLGGVAVPF